MPLSLWAEAAVTVSYLRNISPSGDRTQTPSELFFGDKPDVSDLRVWGSVCYTHFPKAKRQKLDPVSEQGRMIGYEKGTKGYRILLDTGKIKISRDVTFNSSAKPEAPDFMIDPLFTEVGTEDEESEWAPVVPPAAPAAEIAP